MDEPSPTAVVEDGSDGTAVVVPNADAGPAERDTGRRGGVPLWLRGTVLAILAAIGIWSIQYGIALRPQIYFNSDRLHWGDAYNAYTYGKGANEYGGIFHFYEVMHDAQRSGMDPMPNRVTRTAMDYPPLRLAIVTAWARWIETNKDQVPMGLGYNGESSAVILPMLRLNMVTELTSSMLVFAIIWLWVRRSKRDEPLTEYRRWPWAVGAFAVGGILALMWYRSGYAAPEQAAQLQLWRIPLLLGAIALASIFRGAAPALAGALLLWFNPGVLWNSYAFPQWDTWLISFFLGAILLASVESWFFAGVLIATGTFLKGQMLMIAPLFVLWPLFQMKWDAAVRWIAGFALAAAAITLPWMEPTTPAMVSFFLVLFAMALSAPFVLRWKIGWPWFAAMAVISMGCAWAWQSSASVPMRLLPMTLVASLWLLRFARPRVVPHLYALAIGLFVFLMLPMYNLSQYWYLVGFKYGTEKFSIMANPGTNNLPSILEQNFRWTGNPRTMSVPIYGMDEPITMRTLLISLYAICLILSAIGAAIHAKRNDTRFLVAVIAPWICSFALLPQLNNRYLIWAAGMSALLPAVGVGMTLLGVLVSLLAWEGVAQIMYGKFAGGTQIAYYLNPLQTNLGWLLILAAAVYLYVGVIPRRRRALPLA